MRNKFEVVMGEWVEGDTTLSSSKDIRFWPHQFLPKSKFNNKPTTID